LITPEVKTAIGDDQAVNTLISAIDKQTDVGFQQSGVQMQLQVKGWSEVNYQESGDIEKDLDALTRFAIDNDLRRRFGVSAVSLWVTRSEHCGLGNLNMSAEDFRQHAYNVVKVECAVKKFSFAHELGHNLGACHDRDADPRCQGATPFSYGFRDPEGDFRTIMAYECNQGRGCPRINAWSTPNKRLGQKTIGIPNAADNARSLNLVAF
jgi:hypothetical protein